MFTRTLWAALALPLTLAACGQTEHGETTAVNLHPYELTIRDAWSRETAEGQAAGGAFMQIANGTGEADRLVGGSSEIAERVEVHTMVMDDGVMRMRPLADGLEIPAGQVVELRPGSFHIMLMGLKRPLAEGEQLPLQLHFANAGSRTVLLDVRNVTSEGAAGSGHGGSHD